MTAKRVTIGAKPVLVHRETDVDGSHADTHPDTLAGEFGDAAAGPVDGETVAATEPASAASSSIEDWLRKGDGAETAPTTDVVDSGTAAATPSASVTPLHAETDIPPAPVAPVPPKGSAMPPWAGVVGGAVAGAAVAFAVVVLVPYFAPAADLRLAPLSDRLNRLESGLRGTGEQLGRLNNEISQTLDNQTAAVTRLDTQAADITGLRQALAQDTARIDPGMDVSSPVFAVALGQLRATFYTGRPFEAELVSVYAIAGTNDLFSGYLTALAEPARTGMPNAAELRRVFPSYVVAAGLQIGDSSGYRYGLQLVNRYVGLATEPYQLEEANLAVTRADAQLATGDVEGAVATLRDMGAQYITPMQPWFDAARNHVRAETAITEMTRVVMDKLREKVGKEMSVNPASEPASAEPAPGTVTAPAAP